MNKIKALDDQLKSRITESKNARGKVQYKSADEVQQEIDRLRAEVDSGKMTLVNEKKALDNISTLNRVKKGFASFDEVSGVRSNSGCCRRSVVHSCLVLAALV